MGKVKFYLVRHGKIGLDNQKRYIGQSDWELNQEGYQQVKKLQQALKEIHLTQIYCSSLRRTQQTAGILAMDRGLKPFVLPELCEINMGQWEGETFMAIQEKYPQEFLRRGEDVANFRPPEGESFADLQRRVVPVFQQIADRSKDNILMIGHAGVNRVILAHVLGLPLAQIFRFKQDYACLNVISYDGQSFNLEKMNVVF